MTTNDIRVYLTNKITTRFDNGDSFLDINAGTLQKELEIKNRTPMICNAMYQIGEEFTSKIIDSPTKGFGSSLTIRYYKDAITDNLESVPTPKDVRKAEKELAKKDSEEFWRLIKDTLEATKLEPTIKVHNKLVRDEIPAIIIDSGNTPKTRILSDEEYKKELDNKLLEEVNEYLESGDIEEIADIQEVIKAIIKAKGFSKDEVKRIRKEKANKRGGFDDKIFLISVEENN